MARGSGASILAIGFMLAGSPAFAQTVGDTAAPADADIIVTANKREERLQDVAVSIVAIRGETLNQNRLVDIQDLATRVPGLNFQGGGQNGGGLRLILRGLNTGGASATVATVVDEAPLSFSTANSVGADFAANFNPYDMERVEVLKGPQGSLYGATAVGGLVKYVTKAPELDTIEGGFDLGGFNVKGADLGTTAQAYANLPIVEGIAAVRASGYYEYSPGWIDNALGNKFDINEVRRAGGRLSVLLKPTDALSVQVGGLYQKVDTGGPDIVEVNGYADPSDPFGLLNGFNRDSYTAQITRNEAMLLSGNVQYDFGRVTLQSLTSYGKLKTFYDFDNPLYAQIFGGLFFGRPNTTLSSSSSSTLTKWSQEFRLASDGRAAEAGRGLEWQVGLFYTDETALFENDYLTRDSQSGSVVLSPLSPTTPQVFLATLNSDYREIAGYADLTWHFTPRFDLSVGGRLFNNKQSFTQTAGGALFFPPAFTTTGPFRSNETDFTFSVSPRFRITPDVLLYGRIASGYRPGGPNPAIPPLGPPPDFGEAPSTFESDSIISYEAGFKATLFDMLTVDLSAFYIDWTDIQVTASIRRGFTGYSAQLNAGDAVSKGFEWNFGLQPVKGLYLGWLGAYTDASLSESITEINGIAGAQLPYVPKWSTTLTADYEVELSNDWAAFIGGSFAYVGERFTNFSFDPARAYQRLPSYETFSLQGGIRRGPLTLQVYGKNLGNTRGITTYDTGQLLLAFGPPGVPIPGTAGIIRPREVGVRLSGRF